MTDGWKICAEHEGWLLLRNAAGEVHFADRQDRDPADCPVSLLIDLEKHMEEAEKANADATSAQTAVFYDLREGASLSWQLFEDEDGLWLDLGGGLLLGGQEVGKFFKKMSAIGSTSWRPALCRSCKNQGKVPRCLDCKVEYD